MTQNPDVSLTEPSDDELTEIERAIAQPAWEDPLEELFTEVQMKAPAKRGKRQINSLTVSVAEANERLKKHYTDPANWVRTRGVALIDRASGVLLGNYSEYRHTIDPSARKLLREHTPISISATEEVDGYLGEREEEIRAVSWDHRISAVVSAQLDELMVECPAVALSVHLRFGGIVKAVLEAPAQFASYSGDMILQLPAGCDIWLACSTDTKIRIRRETEHG